MKRSALLITLLFVLWAVSPVAAQQGNIDQSELEPFVDDLIDEVFATQAIPGAIVSAVQGNELIFLKGYGYANTVNETPADPSTSLFRIASITKTFTATAIMQLVEQGLIDLNADVNIYLPVEVHFPAQFDQPITVAHLLTHTAGLDETNVVSYPPDQTPTIGEFLKERQPVRLYPPGEVLSYSNYGYSMLGYIVESVSGLPYAEYVQKNILQPLQMDQTYVAHVLPESALPNRARGHYQTEDGWQAVPKLSFPDRPAGVMFSTAENMANYMIAHLNNGQFGNGRILESNTSELMQAQQFAAGAEADGWTYGFTEDTVYGLPTIGHDGDIEGFTSLMFFVPQADFGIFVSFNGYKNLAGAGDPRDLIRTRLIEQFFAQPGETALPNAITDVDVSPYAGTYMSTRFIHEGRDRGLNPSVIDIQLTVTANDDNTITIDYPLDLYPPSTWQLIDEHVFTNVDAPGERTVFRPQDDTMPDHILTTFILPMMFERIAWYEVRGAQLSFFGFIFAMTMVFPLSWGISRLVQRRRRQLPEPSVVRSSALWLGLGATVLGSGIIGIWLRTALSFGATMDGTIYIPEYLTILGGILLLLAIGMLVYTFILWQRSIDTILIRVVYSLTVVSVWLCLWLLTYWRIIVI